MTNLSLPTILAHGHFKSLNGLRALSIILVIFCHYYNYSSNLYLRSIPGNFGVSVFFVLSGFLITSLLLKEKVGRGLISLKSFYIRRALRILPLAYLFFLIVITLSKVCSFSLSVYGMTSAFFFFSNCVDSGFKTNLIGHYWSLSVEEQFYLLSPLLLRWNVNFYRTILILLICISPLTWYLSDHPRLIKDYAFIGVLLMIIKLQTGLIVGSLTSLIIFEYPKILNLIRLRGTANFVLFLTAGILQTRALHLLPDNFVVISDLLIAICILNVIIESRSWFNKFLNWKVTSWIGTISYSLYIWQQLFLFPVNGRSLFFEHSFLNLSLLVIVSAISFYGFEKPISSLRNKFRPKEAGLINTTPTIKVAA